MLQKNLPDYFLLCIITLFFAIFMLYPVGFVLKQAFLPAGIFSLSFFVTVFNNVLFRQSILNSLLLAILVTFITALLSFPLAVITTRYKFPYKKLLTGLLLLPLILPPFVGAIGLRQILSRFGSVNILLQRLHIISQPIDWLSAGFFAVVLMEVLHLYPIMYLNICTALSNIDPNMEDAAKNLGANTKQLFKTIIFPLMLPGLFAGASIVFIWSFTDLGTPLIFDYTRLVSVQIFNLVTEIGENPIGYVLVVIVLLLTLFIFSVAKLILPKEYTAPSKGQIMREESTLKGFNRALSYLLVCSIIIIAIIPHISVFFTSITKTTWAMSILPQSITFKHYGTIFTHPITIISIRNSLFLSLGTIISTLLLGLGIVYLLTRTQVRGRWLIDIFAMLPLAVPGLIIAFGYVATFSNTFLDPRNNPFLLLIIGYTIRRIPYVVRCIYSGIEQVSITYEEASYNLGANKRYTFRKVTLPLISANVLVGAILTFTFSMLEVSESLILAMKEQFYPITKAIYILVGRIADGPYIASAMGFLGMVLLGISLLISNKFLGKRLGILFKV